MKKQAGSKVNPVVLDFSVLDAFHRDSGQKMLATGYYPCEFVAPSEALYRVLVDEEYQELKGALKALEDGTLDNGNITVEDLAEVAKEGLDLIVVVVGLLKSLGIPVTECWNELNRELQSKRLPDGTFLKREDGKVLKPVTFKKADINEILYAAKNRREDYIRNL